MSSRNEPPKVLRTLHVRLKDRGYPIHIGPRALDETGALLSDLGIRGTVFLVTQRKIRTLFGARLRRSLERHGIPLQEILIPDGEQFKTLATVEKIYRALTLHKADRRATLVVLGGGVPGDIAGFAAATYLRGIPYVQIPTSLLAQVDSSVGGKVGVNLREAKNLVGAFHQPSCVIADPGVLKELPRREFVAGLFEVIKYGIIKDPRLFHLLEVRLEEVLAHQEDLLAEIIEGCCRIKARVVERDEREAGLRRILNFGHTFGHALEAATHYRRFKHGEAVAWGMLFATRIAREMRLVSTASALRIGSLIHRLQPLPGLAGIPLTPLLRAMEVDKKVQHGRIHFVLPERIGKVVIRSDVPPALVSKTARQMLST